MRKLVCTDMDYLGITIDASKNDIRSKELREINVENARVKVLVIPTNEEIEIAQQAMELCK
jgi:acetate kinase